MTSSVEVSPVTREAVQAVWPDVEDYIKLAIDRGEGEYSIDDIFQYCLEGQMYLLIAHEGWDIYGVIVAQVLKYPQKKALNCFALAGREFPKWIGKAVERFKEGAEHVGADYIKAYTRPGIAKMLKEYGGKVRCIEVVVE